MAHLFSGRATKKRTFLRLPLLNIIISFGKSYAGGNFETYDYLTLAAKCQWPKNIQLIISRSRSPEFMCQDGMGQCDPKELPS